MECLTSFPRYAILLAMLFNGSLPDFRFFRGFSMLTPCLDNMPIEHDNIVPFFLLELRMRAARYFIR